MYMLWGCVFVYVCSVCVVINWVECCEYIRLYIVVVCVMC